MKKTSQKIGYRNLAFAVLVSAIEDLPRRFKFSKKHSEYEECNFMNRGTAIGFFRHGRFRLWADMTDFSYELLKETYKKRKEEKLYQDRETKEWLSGMGPGEEAA